MRQSATDCTTGESLEDVTAGTTDAAIQLILDALDDAACQAILGATSDERLSAKALSAQCDLPLSTTYRKLDLLTTVGLLHVRTRIRQSGKHTNEYERRIEDVVISLGPNGIGELQLSGPETVPPPSSLYSFGGRDASRQPV